ncbi:MAG: chorismate mutase [bacterium]
MLNEARLIINEIDQQMIELFIKRMDAVKKVLIYKKENNLNVFDQKRELEIIEKNIKLLNNKELEKYYQIFFEGMLTASKQYQEDNYE